PGDPSQVPRHPREVDASRAPHVHVHVDSLFPTQIDKHAVCFFVSSRRRHTRSVSAFLLNRSSDLTLQAGTSAVSDKLLDLVGLGGKSAADKGKDTRDYLAAAFPELNAWERAGADASSAGMVDA